MDDTIEISGTIECGTDDLNLVLEHLPEHVAFSRKESGCLEFSIVQSENMPCVFQVSERFQNRAAFERHTARTRASRWWVATKHIPRNLKITGC